MAGAEDVLTTVNNSDRTQLAALVLNNRGLERALSAAGVDEIHFAFGASESFNQQNAGASVADALRSVVEVVTGARRHGLGVTVTIAVAFGCPFEGRVDEGYVLDLVAQVSELEVDEVVLADTIGIATPSQVARLARQAAQAKVPVGLHLHNTRGAGLANAWAGLEAGVSSFDASVGGIGGCPFAPGATGNIATEDLLYILENEGFETGVDLDRLVRVARWLESLLEHPLPGAAYRAAAA